MIYLKKKLKKKTNKYIIYNFYNIRLFKVERADKFRNQKEETMNMAMLID